jgi:CheY-like chemotaxis protein
MAQDPGQQTRKILIVDDEPDTRALMRAMLAGLSSPCEIIEAYGGKHALQVIAALKPDLVLLDIIMPDMDGLGVLMELKRDPATRNTKVVLVTARAEERMVQTGLVMGAADYISKPFTQEQLVSLVERLLPP